MANKEISQLTNVARNLISSDLVEIQAGVGGVSYNANWNQIIGAIPPTLPQVKIDGADTTPGYLNAKISAGSGISTSILNIGGNEQLRISSTIVNADKVKISNTDTTPDYLGTKISAGSGIVTTILNPGADEQLRVSLLDAPVNAIVPLTYNTGTGDLALSYNTSNLKVTASQLNTIQDITTTSDPTFNNVIIGSLPINPGGRVFYASSSAEFSSSGDFFYNEGLSALRVGSSNNVTGLYGACIGGQDNTCDGQASATLGGEVIKNSSTAEAGVCAGGFDNTNNSTYGAIIGGQICTTDNGLSQGVFCSKNSVIVGASESSVLLGGFINSIHNSNFSSILSGASNTIVNSDDATILAGNGNEVNDGSYGLSAGLRAKVHHQASMIIQMDPTPASDFVSTNIGTIGLKAINGIGLQTASPNSDVSLSGTVSFGYNSTAVSAGTTALDSNIIAVTDTSSPRTITLNSADCVSGRLYRIKDESGGAQANNITIAPDGGKTIDGTPSVLISVNFGSAIVYSNGTNWFTL